MINLFLNSKNIKRDAFLWNTISSTLLAGMSALLLIVVVRFLDDMDAAIFALGFSIAQMMLTIGYFDMRAFQATDVTKKHAFKQYFTSRIITCVIMLIVSLIYISLKNYDFYKSSLIFALCVFKMLDALEDVIHGLFQVNKRLDIAGKLQATRIIICMITFVLSIIFTKNLLFSIILIIILSIIIIIFLNIPIISMFDKLEIDYNIKNVTRLLIACLPLFIGSYLSLYIGNAPKYAIDLYMEPINQTYFNILFMPSYVVNLFCGFALRPLLTTLAIQYNESHFQQFKKTILKLLALIGVLTVIVEIGAFLMGIPILSIVYDLDLSEFKYHLLILILAGGVSSLGTSIYYALTIMRNQRLLLISYVITGFATFLLSPLFVREYGMEGAAVVTLITLSLRTAIFILIFIICYRKNVKSIEQSKQ